MKFLICFIAAITQFFGLFLTSISVAVIIVHGLNERALFAFLVGVAIIIISIKLWKNYRSKNENLKEAT